MLANSNQIFLFSFFYPQIVRTFPPFEYYQFNSIFVVTAAGYAAVHMHTWCHIDICCCFNRKHDRCLTIMIHKNKTTKANKNTTKCFCVGNDGGTMPLLVVILRSWKRHLLLGPLLVLCLLLERCSICLPLHISFPLMISIPIVFCG